jgi:hypothetical protein
MELHQLSRITLLLVSLGLVLILGTLLPRSGYAELAPVEKGLAETRQDVVDTNQRISSLDQYDLVTTVTVLFPVNKGLKE